MSKTKEKPEHPFAEEVIQRDYAENGGGLVQDSEAAGSPAAGSNGSRSAAAPGAAHPPKAGTHQKALPPASKEADCPPWTQRPDSPSENTDDRTGAAEKKAQKEPTVLGADFVVEDDEEFEQLRQREQQANQAYDQVPEMEYEPIPEDESGAEVIDSEGVYHDLKDAGGIALSEQIYSNLAILVPQGLHELSRVRDERFRSAQVAGRPLSRDVLDPTLQHIHQHNQRQKQKFRWGELHEKNIQRPLRSLMRQQGWDSSVSPGGQLLIGLGTVLVVTFILFKEVKRENRDLEDRLLRQIQDIVSRHSAGRPPKADGRQSAAQPTPDPTPQP